jgi:hypothetical protein
MAIPDRAARRYQVALRADQVAGKHYRVTQFLSSPLSFRVCRLAGFRIRRA